jgi:hypothetical protein
VSNHSCLSIPRKALWVVASAFFQRNVPSAALVMQEGSGVRRKLRVRRARGEMDLPQVPADDKERQRKVSVWRGLLQP